MLVLFSNTERETIYWNIIPSRSLVHAFLFGVFSFLLLSFCKKQLTYEHIRRNSFKLVLVGSFSAAFILEGAGMLSRGTEWHVLAWNILFDSIGSAIGMGVFHLFYRSSY